MAVLELRAEIPDLFERIENALLNQKSELKGVTFHEGIFISPDCRLKGILGYDSSARLRLVYSPDPEIPNFDKPENIRVAPTPHIHVLGCNYGLHKSESCWEGKIRFLQNAPLVLDVIVSSDHLHSPPYQGGIKIPGLPKERTSDELVEIVKSLRLEDKIRASDSEREIFRFKEMLLLLEWIKLNMRYACQKNDYMDALRDREGVCTQFSEIFERMVYVAGGFAFHINTFTFNLPLGGWNYFSVCPDLVEGHELTGVYYGGRWHVVDPTIYNSTYYNPQIQTGHETRAYSPRIRNYHLVRINPPFIQFLDRNLLESATRPEERLKIQIKLERGCSSYVTLMPKVDKQSVVLLA
ncbi:MAG: hypothetical protein KKC75_00370 [Nanoarchaeota archaeon]|nr:hypothetical protein [Nanoarchaeota archaeon]MBU1005558.1 hypothetical protein [Nanoarchaeota archaeon]MBU1945950.1 hypothetical protein [Nanoarchaeota archaeon]